MVILCFILRFGVAKAVGEANRTTRGLFVLACICGGIIGGGFFIIFRQTGALLASALGGLSFALFLQACHAGGLIATIGLRYILYAGLTSLTFALACHPRLQSYVLIFSSAHTGIAAVVLGIDCFSRAGLKEFYVRNLGFDDIFEKRFPQAFADTQWPLTSAQIIELGILAGASLMAIAFQTRLWAELKANVRLMRSQDQERHLQARAKRAAKSVFAESRQDLREWEKHHGSSRLSSDGEISTSFRTALRKGCSSMTTRQSSSGPGPGMDSLSNSGSIENANRGDVFGLHLTQHVEGLSTCEAVGLNNLRTPRTAVMPGGQHMQRSGSLQSPYLASATFIDDNPTQHMLKRRRSAPMSTSLQTVAHRKDEGSPVEVDASLKEELNALHEKEALLERIRELRANIEAARGQSITPESSMSAYAPLMSQSPSTQSHGGTRAPTPVVPSATSVEQPNFRDSSPWMVGDRSIPAEAIAEARSPSSSDHLSQNLASSLQHLNSPTNSHIWHRADQGVHKEVFPTSQPLRAALPKSPSPALCWVNPAPRMLSRHDHLGSACTTPHEIQYQNHQDDAERTKASPYTLKTNLLDRTRPCAIQTSSEDMSANNEKQKLSSPSQSPNRFEKTHSSRNNTLTTEKLREKHYSRLRAMQQPLNEHLDEAARLQLARDEWNRRAAAERRTQVALRKEQGQLQRPQKPRNVCFRSHSVDVGALLSASKSDGLTCMRSDETCGTRQTPSTSPLDAHLLAQRQQSGASRAREWRKSLGDPSDLMTTAARPYAQKGPQRLRSATPDKLRSKYRLPVTKPLLDLSL